MEKLKSICLACAHLFGMRAEINLRCLLARATKQKLKETGATSEETAKTPKQLGLDEKWLKMSAPAGVVATQDCRYYIASQNKK
jgi:hypothetical protein